VRACEAHKYDLILMDLQMPKMDGYEATRHIRSRSLQCAKTPILALTANADLETRQACLEQKMDEVLTKPIRRHSLLSAVDQWIGVRDETPDRSEGCLRHGTDGSVSKENVPIDYDVALEEFGDVDLVDDVVAHFINKVESQIQDMRNALAEQDMEGLKRDVHAIKGGAGTLEAEPLAKVAEKMEDLCKVNGWEELPFALESVAGEFDRLRTYVKSHSWS